MNENFETHPSVKSQRLYFTYDINHTSGYLPWISADLLFCVVADQKFSVATGRDFSKIIGLSLSSTLLSPRLLNEPEQASRAAEPQVLAL